MKYLLFIPIYAISALLVYGQQTVTGKVQSLNKELLIGATVQILGKE